MQIRVLVCDDDKKFVQDMVERLKELTADRPICITGCSAPEKLTDQFLSDFQIMFLDIDMGNYNGLEIARRVRKLRLDTVLIFVTHYMEYSPEGYEVKAFRYLLKSNIEEKLPRYLMYKTLPSPKLVLAKLGNEAGIIGAAMLGKAQ